MIDMALHSRYGTQYATEEFNSTMLHRHRVQSESPSVSEPTKETGAAMLSTTRFTKLSQLAVTWPVKQTLDITDDGFRWSVNFRRLRMNLQKNVDRNLDSQSEQATARN